MISGKPILNQDPRLRAMVLPIFKFDPNAPSNRPIGLGTVFRIDPWGNCATAFHVIEDKVTLQGSNVKLVDDVGVTALEIEGILFGAPPLPPDGWRPLVGFSAIVGAKDSPLLHQKPEIRNVSELACLTFPRSHQRTPMPFMPVALGFDVPAVGDIITGYGFAGLDVGKSEDEPMSQYLYQSTGEVIEIIPADPASTMPWPRIRVSAEWPSGMSGGPAVNAQGTVIGVISQGWEGEADSTATYFAGWEVARTTFVTLDPFAVRRFRAFAAIDSKGEVCFLGQDFDEAKAFASPKGLKVLAVSCTPETGEWVSL